MRGFDAPFAAARTAQRSAHCAYSIFAAGAAVRPPGGAHYASCNVENPSYPEGLRREFGIDELLPHAFATHRSISATFLVGTDDPSRLARRDEGE